MPRAHLPRTCLQSRARLYLSCCCRNQGRRISPQSRSRSRTAAYSQRKCGRCAPSLIACSRSSAACTSCPAFCRSSSKSIRWSSSAANRCFSTSIADRYYDIESEQGKSSDLKRMEDRSEGARRANLADLYTFFDKLENKEANKDRIFGLVAAATKTS